jgi:hypothetical protein
LISDAGTSRGTPRRTQPLRPGITVRRITQFRMACVSRTGGTRTRAQTTSARQRRRFAELVREPGYSHYATNDGFCIGPGGKMIGAQSSVLFFEWRKRLAD